MLNTLITVLIVDDHQLIRYSFKSLFNQAKDIEVIGDVSTGEAAIEFTHLHHPDVILMDLRMPGIGGLKATQKITQDYPETRILVVSSCEEEPFPSSLLAAGATGFLSKNDSNDELLTAVRTVATGAQYLSQKIADSIGLNPLESTDRSPFSTLSNEELRVTLMLIRGEKGKYIAEKMHIDPKTVSAYRSRIYGKLHVRTDVALALLAIRYGLVDETVILKK